MSKGDGNIMVPMLVIVGGIIVTAVILALVFYFKGGIDTGIKCAVRTAFGAASGCGVG